MRILITNDDGINAPGLHALARAASNYGEVIVVAPDRERSACGHSMTMRDPLRVWPVTGFNFKAFEVSGLPVDCVNVALTICFPDGCDLILSGINNGPNLGYDITYSGTCGAAMEGAINDVRSVAVSMARFVTGAPLHYETGEQWLNENWEMVVNAPMPAKSFLNIHVQSVNFVELRGHPFSPKRQGVYKDRVEQRDDPWGRPYYWQGGVVVMNPQEQPHSDVEAVSEGFVSLTPLLLDWTARGHLETLSDYASTFRA